MASTTQMITITPLNTDTPAFDISAADIINVIGINSDADSKVTYVTDNRTLKQISVAEANTLISSTSLQLIPYTALSNGDVIYINAERVKKIFVNGTGSQISYDQEGAAWVNLYATDTAAAMLVLVNSIADITPIPLAQHITATTQSTSVATGAFVDDGGAGIAKNLYVGGLINVAGQINGAATTDSTVSTTGAIITAGGLGVAKAMFVGGLANIAGVLTAVAGSVFGARNTYKGATTITAFAGGGQGSATAITAEQNNVTVCATAADSVLLPTASLGAKITIKNNGAADLAVFPAGAGTINGGSASASITIPVGSTKIFEGTTTLNWETYGILTTALGTASRPSHTFNAQSNQGFYSVSSTQLGTSVSGALVGGWNASGLFTSAITEQVTGSGVTLSKNIIRQKTATALNSTGTVTAAMINKGLITSTSAAGVTATLDTATAIGTQIGAVDGTEIDFIVDNTAGANTVTVAVGAGITVCSGVVTGSDTLTVSVANAIGVFKLVFSSATVAKLYRIG